MGLYIYNITIVGFSLNSGIEPSMVGCLENSGIDHHLVGLAKVAVCNSEA
jgi:hypothetical protein